MTKPLTIKTEQSIKGLEAAYFAVFHNTLLNRVTELHAKYGNRVDNLHTELNPDNSVPCHWLVSDLVKHYGLEV